MLSRINGFSVTSDSTTVEWPDSSATISRLYPSIALPEMYLLCTLLTFLSMHTNGDTDSCSLLCFESRETIGAKMTLI